MSGYDNEATRIFRPDLYPDGGPAGKAQNDDPVKCGCDEFPECTHALYWYQGFKAGEAHPRAASAEPAPQLDEVAWLIERGGLCLGFCEYKFTWVTFTNKDALRFSRQRDAYSFMEAVKWKPFNLPLEGATTTEHGWG